MLIPSIDLRGGRVVQLVQGRRAGAGLRRCVRVGGAVRGVSPRAGDRPRRRHGRAATTRQLVARICRRAPVPRRRRAATPRGGGPRPRRRRAGGDPGFGALPPTAESTTRSPRRWRGVRRGARHRAPSTPGAGAWSCSGWRQTLSITRPRTRPAARAVVRRLPLHPRRHGGTDARASTWTPSRRVRDATARRLPPPAASPRGTRSTPSTRWASTRWWAWRSTRGCCCFRQCDGANPESRVRIPNPGSEQVRVLAPEVLGELPVGVDGAVGHARASTSVRYSRAFAGSCL